MISNEDLYVENNNSNWKTVQLKNLSPTTETVMWNTEEYEVRYLDVENGVLSLKRKGVNND